MSPGMEAQRLLETAGEWESAAAGETVRVAWCCVFGLPVFGLFFDGVPANFNSSLALGRFIKRRGP